MLSNIASSILPSISSKIILKTIASVSLLLVTSSVIIANSVSNNTRFATHDAIGSIDSSKRKQPSGKSNYKREHKMENFQTDLWSISLREKH